MPLGDLFMHVYVLVDDVLAGGAAALSARRCGELLRAVARHRLLGVTRFSGGFRERWHLRASRLQEVPQKRVTPRATA
jgi:hypothetical protein